MIISCIEKKLEIYSLIKNSFFDFQILQFKASSDIAISYSDIYLIDISSDMSLILNLLNNRNKKSQYFLVYNSFRDIESFVACFKGVVTFVSFEELITHPGCILGSADKGENENQSSSKISGISQDLHWELLNDLFDNAFKKETDLPGLSKWIAAYLNVSKIIVFKSEKEKDFVYTAAFGCSEKHSAQFHFGVASPFIEYMINTQNCIAAGNSVQDVNDSPESHINILKSLKMCGALILNEYGEEKFLLFFSGKITGCPFTWTEIKNVKKICEFILSRNAAMKEMTIKNTVPPSEIKSSVSSGYDQYDNLRNFAMRTSNEFKNALVSIKTFTQLLPEKYRDANFRKDFFNVLSREILRIEQLMDTISFFSAPFVPNLKPENPGDIIKNVSREIIRIFPGITFEFNDFPEKIKILCDEKWLAKGFSAIFTNAAQAMENEGIIKVTFGSVNKDLRLADHLEVEITDSGKGISSDLIQNVFDPFISTKPNGLGLGLTFTKSIIEAHGGNIEIRNLQPKGVLVRISLKISKQLDTLLIKDLIYKN